VGRGTSENPLEKGGWQEKRIVKTHGAIKGEYSDWGKEYAVMGENRAMNHAKPKHTKKKKKKKK